MRTAAPQPAPQSAGRATRRLHGRAACTGGQAPHRVSGAHEGGRGSSRGVEDLGRPGRCSGNRGRPFSGTLSARGAAVKALVYVCVYVCWAWVGGGSVILPCRNPALSCPLPLAIVAIMGRGGPGNSRPETPAESVWSHAQVPPATPRRPCGPLLNDKRVLGLLGPM